MSRDDRRLTPQQKKALSYERDRRNVYGENDKSSRKSIPLRKRLVNKANRHADRQSLGEAVGRLNPDVADNAEQRLAGKRRKVWKKRPDAPLGEFVARQKERRARRQG